VSTNPEKEAKNRQKEIQYVGSTGVYLKVGHIQDNNAIGIKEMPQRQGKRKLSNMSPKGDIVENGNKQGNNSTQRLSYAPSYLSLLRRNGGLQGHSWSLSKKDVENFAVLLIAKCQPKIAEKRERSRDG